MVSFLKKGFAITLSLSLLAGTVLMSYPNKAYASSNAFWNPIDDLGLAGNSGFNPMDVLSQNTENKTQGDLSAPSPFQTVQDPQATSPDEPVDLTTGILKLSEKDVSLPAFGPPVEISRSYYSDRPEKKGMFGYGWYIPQERYLQLFADFTMTDFHADGSHNNYLYTKNNPDLLIESYDDDPTIYYPLHEGFYTAEDPNNKSILTRRGPGDYLLVDQKTGERFAFAGYKAPWRAQPGNAGKLLRYTNRAGHVVFMDYDEQGRITYMYSNSYPALRIEYQGDLVHKVIEESGRNYIYGYDGADNLTSVTHPDGSKVEMTYDGNHRVTSRTIAGIKTGYRYDEQGRVTAILDGADRPILEYQYSGDTVIKKDAMGNTTSYIIQDKKIVKKHDSNGDVFSYLYDAQGKIKEMTTKYGTSKFDYDTNGNMTSRIDPLNRETVTIYDQNLNLPIEVRQPGGAVWKYSYGDAGELLTMEDPMGNVTRYIPHPHWRVISEQHDPDGKVTKFKYNSFAQIATVTDSLEQTTTYIYDSSNRLKEIVNPNGAKTSLLYEDNGDKPTKITSPTGVERKFVYDKGRLTKTIDERGFETNYSYDSLGRLDVKTDPLGEKTHFSYDGMGRLETVKNPAGKTVSFTWDYQGRLKERKGEGIVPAEYQYDIYGELSELNTPKN